ncbi:MAG: acyltransferase family protein, partial [Gaiellaceae bacterium]
MEIRAPRLVNKVRPSPRLRFRVRGVAPSTGRRLPGVEGLRAIAATSILVVHTWGEASRSGPADLGRIGNNHIGDLSYGVTLFFALSGFLLYRPFVAAMLHSKPRPAFTKYLRNRGLRILPAYWVILLLSALVLGSVFFRDSQGALHHGRLTDPGLLARAGLFIQDYDPKTLLTGIAPAWSLAVEAVFYLALPLLVLIAYALGSRARHLNVRIAAALAPAAILLVIGLAGKAVAWKVFPAPIWAGWSTDWHAVIERSFFGQADLFSFGMALAVARILWEDGRLRLPRHWRAAAAITAVAAYVVSSRVSWMEAQLSYSPYNTLMALACALLLALVVLAPPDRSYLVRLLESRWLVGLGVISYSIFLWHDPLIFALRDHGLTFAGRGGLVANLAIVFAATVLLSWLTYRLVEAPALRLKFRDRGATEAPA